MGSIRHDLDRRGRKIYYIDYSVKGVRRREHVGYSKKEAENALQSRLTDIRRKKFDHILPESHYTLEQIENQYLRHSKTTKSPHTYERDQNILACHLIPRWGRTSLNEIESEQVEEYQSKRIADGVAPATINKEVQLLKNIVKKAVDWKKIRTNFVAIVKPLKTPPGRVRYLELEQIPRLMKACPPWLRPIVRIAMHTGMRRGEFVNLQRSNIDKQNRLIVLNNTKNNERKTIPMNDTVWEIVQSLPTRLDTPYLFAEKNGKPLSANKVSMAFRKACETSGVDDFSLHDLRHHFASYLTMAGQNQRTVQELLGHKTPAMTARYSHLSPGHLRKAVEQLDRSFG